MQKKAEDQMGSSHLPFSPYLLKNLTLAVLLIAVSSCGYLFSSAFLTLLVMVLSSSLFFLFSKRSKQLQESNLVKRPQHMDGHRINVFVGEAEVEEILLDSVDQIPAYSDSSMSDDESPEAAAADHTPASSDGTDSDDESSAEDVDRVPVSLRGADSEQSSVADTDRELPPPSSESSISDEESLIEIALPDGHFVWPEEPECVFQRNSPGFLKGFSPELVFRQPGLLDLLSEMNEEDNLIEIDIAVGSVKCPRLGIKA